MNEHEQGSVRVRPVRLQPYIRLFYSLSKLISLTFHPKLIRLPFHSKTILNKTMFHNVCCKLKKFKNLVNKISFALVLGSNVPMAHGIGCGAIGARLVANSQRH
jgi:hypothetical protein